MIYIKATIIAIVAACLFAALALEIEAQYREYQAEQVEARYGFGVVASRLGTIGPAAAFGFIGGFYWAMKRGRKQARQL